MALVPNGYVPTENNNKKAEIIVKYTERLCQIAHEYNADITELDKRLKDMRAEKIHFYKDILPEIEKKLKMDSVRDENRVLWVQELRDNFEKSFDITQSLITDFVTDELNEYKAMLKSSIERV